MNLRLAPLRNMKYVLRIVIPGQEVNQIGQDSLNHIRENTVTAQIWINTPFYRFILIINLKTLFLTHIPNLLVNLLNIVCDGYVILFESEKEIVWFQN